MQAKAATQTQRLGKDAGFLTVRATGSPGGWASGRRRFQASGLRGWERLWALAVETCCSPDSIIKSH